MSYVNGTRASHLSRDCWRNNVMRPNPRKVLADNLRRIIGPDSNPTRWATEHRIQKKPVQRMLTGNHSTTVDTIEMVAKAADLTPWQLLVPNLDPQNPPVFMMTKAEHGLYAKLREDFQRLPGACD